MSEGREKAQQAIDAGRKATKAARTEVEGRMADARSGPDEPAES